MYVGRIPDTHLCIVHMLAETTVDARSRGSYRIQYCGIRTYTSLTSNKYNALNKHNTTVTQLAAVTSSALASPAETGVPRL